MNDENHHCGTTKEKNYHCSKCGREYNTYFERSGCWWAPDCECNAPSCMCYELEKHK